MRDSREDPVRREGLEALHAQVSALERALAEQRDLVRELAERDLAFRSLLENGSTLRGIVEIDGDGVVPVWWNRSAVEILGGVQVPEAWRERCRRAAAERRSISLETTHGSRTLLVEFHPVSSGVARRPRLAWMATDVTEQRRLEQQYLQAQKMEALGRLAGGLAHDFNNLLGVIIGYSELLQGDLAEGDPRREQVAEIRRAGERGAKLTRQLLSFSRKHVVEPRVVDLNGVLAETGRMLRRLIGEDVSLRWLPAEGALPVLVDPAQVDQVVLNLAVNARDAMPAGGTLTLATGRAGPEEPVPAPVKRGSWATLAVRDTGTGMTPEVRAHLFEPFFTTKEAGKGTGLGLATVYGIVKQCGGFIRVESEPGAGSVFRLFLPLAESRDAGLPAPAAGAPTEVPRGSETLLVVEDDDAIRALLRELALQFGYSVLSASGAGAALELATHHPGPIDLLVTELVTAGTTGRELAARLRTTRPETRTLFMVGLTDTAAAAPPDPAVAYIQKPIRREAFARKLRDVLERKPR